MAYTIYRTNGTTLTTIQDGTIDTVSTSLSLPGRNHAGYGSALDTNFVQMLENFASSTPPANPLKGQLWFNTTLNTLNVCPADNTTNALQWLTLTSTNSGGSTTLGNLTVTGNIATNNLAVTNALSSDTFSTRLATFTGNIATPSANITAGVIGSVTTQTITTGGSGTAGILTGSWTVVGNALTGGNALAIQSGNIAFTPSSTNGVKCDNYMYSNGAPFNPSGTYTNSNVSDYLTGSNAISQFTGNIAPTKVTTTHLAGGGMITGTWTIDAANGASLQSTYADLAERFYSDAIYEVGTVVEIGGVNEITICTDDLSNNVFGVISNTAAYLMNGMAGDNDTHPAVALSGRVKVKVIGRITKGDRLVSAGNGLARSATVDEVNAFNVIGRALEDKNIDTEDKILAIVTVK
jgi:hypothetical protein